MYDDPRDLGPIDQHDVLTEDSDDALADLEKEFAVKKQKLMEERARKRERARNSFQVERSPSPKRPKQAKPEQKVFANRTLPKEEKPSVAHDVSRLPAPAKAFERVSSVPADHFATRLLKNENQVSSVDYNDRLLEFENVPPRKPVVPMDGSQDFVTGEVLRQRYIEESAVKHLLQNTKILRISKLLAKVIAPHYEEPAYTNWCFAGIIIYKSDPKTASSGKKFITLRVGSFNQTVDVFLFGDAFQRFWKLQCGEVIAILNPTVKKYGSAFNLRLQDDINNILEIGASKYYGHCSATSKQGEACKFVIDLSKNDLCSFHEESKYKRGSRMELQGSVKPKAPTNKEGQTSQAFVSGSTYQPLFLQYANPGFSEKDTVYSGGEQFNEAKYDRPVKESEAAKLRKRKANESLRMQLLNNAPPSRLNDLDKLGIVPSKQSEIVERQNSLSKIRSHAFKNKFLTGMGYDPTFEKTQRLDKVQPTKSMEELRSISKTKKVSLKPSEDDQLKRRQRQKQAMSIIKPATSGIPARPNTVSQDNGSRQELKIAADSNKERRKVPCDSSGFESAGSDSDLEIAFACDEDRVRYKHAISAPASTRIGGETPSL